MIGNSGRGSCVPPACCIEAVSAVQPTHGSSLVGRVFDVALVDLLLRFQRGVDGLRGDVLLSALLEQQRAEVAVVDDDVDELADDCEHARSAGANDPDRQRTPLIASAK
jgi:hypothetical protein